MCVCASVGVVAVGLVWCGCGLTAWVHSSLLAAVEGRRGGEAKAGCGGEGLWIGKGGGTREKHGQHDV